MMSIDLSKKFTSHVQTVTGSADVIVPSCYVTTCRCCIVCNHLIIKVTELTMHTQLNVERTVKYEDIH